ncbi:hypothetical protein [Actinoplanes siamensis]|nr:hypothetical protein [Actinoplanes siamensis]
MVIHDRRTDRRGVALGVLLMRVDQDPILFRAATVLTPATTGAALVLLTTAAMLIPAARRITRTEDLRYEQGRFSGTAGRSAAPIGRLGGWDEIQT